MKDYLVIIEDADMNLCIFGVTEITYFHQPDFSTEITCFRRGDTDLCIIPTHKITEIQEV